jgi:hypothetical protein
LKDADRTNFFENFYLDEASRCDDFGRFAQWRRSFGVPTELTNAAGKIGEIGLSSSILALKQ